MTKRAIFVAATGQNVGKTTLCLGLIAALRNRFESVGFIKPVGQQHVQVEKETKVDKDVVLFKEHFHLGSNWSDMSPVIVPSGFTREYLDGKITEESMKNKIIASFEKIYSGNSYTVVEGTGHVGVGSIVNLHNVHIAKLLGLEMVIIASGGLGSAFDELTLNLALCEKHDVKVRGIILNKVLEPKREMILEYFPKTLKKYGIPLIGCVPYNPFLSNPTMKDFEYLFGASFLSGEEHRFRHFQHTRLVASSVEAYQQEMIPNELIITPASRHDIIEATVEKHLEVREKEGTDFGGGMILTSVQPPSEETTREISKANIPILYTPVCSYDAMKMITSFNAKIRWEDTLKVDQAIELVEKHIDFDELTRASLKQKEIENSGVKTPRRMAVDK